LDLAGAGQTGDHHVDSRRELARCRGEPGTRTRREGRGTPGGTVPDCQWPAPGQVRGHGRAHRPEPEEAEVHGCGAPFEDRTSGRFSEVASYHLKTAGLRARRPGCQLSRMLIAGHVAGSLLALTKRCD